MSAALALPPQSFREAAKSHPLWRHEFLRRCESGAISLAETRALARQMYRFSGAFNRILANILVHCPDEAARVVIAENLFEELGEGDPAMTHPELFRRFTRALGITDQALHDAPIEPETAALVATYMDMPERRGWLAALGAVCFASEGIVAALYRQLQRGIAFAVPLDPSALAFFDVHISVDNGHAAKLAEVVEAHVADPADADSIVAAIAEAMNARVRFFDGVTMRARRGSLWPVPANV